MVPIRIMKDNKIMKFRDYTTLNLTANIEEDTETDSQKTRNRQL